MKTNKDLIAIIIEEIKALEMELFPEYFTDSTVTTEEQNTEDTIEEE